MNLNSKVKVTTALDHAEGSTSRNGATLDMKGFEGVRMIVKFGDIAGTAVTSIKAQSGAQSDMSDAADLEGTGITVADSDDNQIFMIDLFRPRERYVRVVVSKATANTEEMAIYEQYGAKALPVDNNVADAVTSEIHASPAEGTA